MSHRKRPSQARATGDDSRQRRAMDVLGGACATCVALVTHRSALGDAFGPDDLMLLEQARGLRAWAAGPWRFVSGPLFWGVGAGVFGGDAARWHVVVWLLHGAVVAATYALARLLGAPRAIALAAAIWFGCHRLLFDTLVPVSSIGEVISTLLIVMTLCIVLTLRDGAGRWLSAATCAAALLCKESVALVPLAVLLASGRGVKNASATRMWLAALAGAGAVWLVWLKLAGYAPGGPAYALGFGRNIGEQLLRYLAVAADPLTAVPDLDSPHGPVRGLVTLGVLTSGAWLAWYRTRLPAIGLAGFVLALGPVLLLRETRHLHYLYCPLVFLGLAVASMAWAIADWIVGRVRVTHTAALSRAGSAVLAAMLAAYIVQANRAIVVRGKRWIDEIALPYDPLLRKMAVARNALESLGPVLDEPNAKLVIVQPPARDQSYSVRSGARVGLGAGRPVYDLVSAVLDSGRAISAVYPQIREVRISSEMDGDIAGWWIASHYANGRLEVAGRGDQGRLELIKLFQRWGYDTTGVFRP